MSKPSGKVVTQGSNKNLRLMLETAESLGVDNAVPVTLEGGPYWARLFVSEPAQRRFTFHRIERKAFFPLLNYLANIKLAHHLIFNLASALVTISLVVPIMSGLIETEVIPHSTSFSVSSGYTEGACPQIEEVTPILFDTLIALSRAISTASFRSSNWCILISAYALPLIKNETRYKAFAHSLIIP